MDDGDNSQAAKGAAEIATNSNMKRKFHSYQPGTLYGDFRPLVVAKKHRAKEQAAPVRPPSAFQRFVVAEFGESHTIATEKMKTGEIVATSEYIQRRNDEVSLRWRELDESQRAKYISDHGREWDEYVKNVDSYVKARGFGMKQKHVKLKLPPRARAAVRAQEDATSDNEENDSGLKKRTKKLREREDRDRQTVKDIVQFKAEYDELAKLSPFEVKLMPYKEQFRPQNDTTGWHVYINERKKEVRMDSGDSPSISLDLEDEAKKWNTMSADERKPYEDRASLGTTTFQKKLKEYKTLCKIRPPPRPALPNHIFRRERSEWLCSEWAKGNHGDVSLKSFLGSMWSKIPEEEKRYYRSRACEEEAVYASRLKKFECLPWVVAFVRAEIKRKRREARHQAEKLLAKERSRALARVNLHSAASARIRSYLSSRLAEPIQDRETIEHEYSLFVDWRALSKTEFGKTPLQRTEHLDPMIGWATHLLGTTQPGHHNPLLGLANIPPRAQLVRELITRADNLAKDRSLRHLHDRFDNSAAVALAMLMEEMMTTLLMPFANEHVKKCRSYELQHDRTSPDWILAPEEAIARLDGNTQLISAEVASRVCVENLRKSEDFHPSVESTWGSWCASQSINPDRAASTDIFFFRPPELSEGPPDENQACPDDSCRSTDDEQQLSLEEVNDFSSDEEQQSIEEV